MDNKRQAVIATKPCCSGLRIVVECLNNGSKCTYIFANVMQLNTLSFTRPATDNCGKQQ